MEVEFISQGKVVHKGQINEKIIINSNSFSIPISVCSDKDINDNISSKSSEFLNKKTERKVNEESDEDQNNSNNNNNNNVFDTNNILFPKKKKYYQNDYDESEEEDDDNDEESEEYEESDNELSEENDDSAREENTNSNNNKNNSDYDNSISNSNNTNINKKNNKIRGDSSESSSKNYNNQRMLRKYGAISAKDNEFYGLGGSGKKIKKELTEEEIAKKTEQARLRKLHAKKLIEEEKREAVERILNEDGRKLRERQKKHNEEMKKKKKMEEEKMKKNLTKIITKYSKDGKIYVRFPQGFLLPSIFNQQKKICKPIIKCHVEGCQNLRKYTDPKTGFPYCSVQCFKILRNQIQNSEENKNNL